MDRGKIVADCLNLICKANLDGAATSDEWSSTVQDYFVQCSQSSDSDSDTSQCSDDESINASVIEVDDVPSVVVDAVKAWEAHSDLVIEDCPDVEKAKVDKFRLVDIF